MKTCRRKSKFIGVAGTTATSGHYPRIAGPGPIAAKWKPFWTAPGPGSRSWRAVRMPAPTSGWWRRFTACTWRESGGHGVQRARSGPVWTIQARGLHTGLPVLGRPGCGPSQGIRLGVTLAYMDQRGSQPMATANPKYSVPEIAMHNLWILWRMESAAAVHRKGRAPGL